MEQQQMDPISAAVAVLGDRWTLLILRDVVFADRRNFRALLLGSSEGIASNILSDRLVRLVEAGLLVRGEGRRGQRAKYRLTEAGIQTVPILLGLADWGREWREADITADATVVPPTSSAARLMTELRRTHLDLDEA